MATLTERIAVIIDSKTTGSTDVRKLGADMDDLDGKSNRARGSIANLGIAGGAALKAGIVGGAAAAGAALVSVGKAGVDAYVGLADQVRTFQRASGATAEEASRFIAVFDDMGISADKASTAVGKLARVDPDKLREFGVEVAKNADGTANLEQTLLNVADAYSNTRDPAARARLVFEAFGRQGQDLVPILEQGRTGLREFFAEADGNHQILSQEDLDAARNYELAMDQLQDAVGGLSREIGQGLVPGLADTANGIAATIDGMDKLLEPIGGLSTVTETLTGGVFSLIGQLTGGKDAAEDAAGAQEQLEGATDGTTQAIKEQEEATREAEQATRDMINATIASFNSELAYEQATDKLAEAHRDLAVKQREATEAQRIHGSNSYEAKVAQEALADAERNLRGAHLDVAGAAARVAEDHAKATGATDGAKAATDAFRSELSRLRDATAPGSPLRAHLDGLVWRLDSVQGTRVSNIVVNTYQRTFTSTGGRSGFGGPSAFADGGWIGGVGGPRADNQIVLASPGEFIVNARSASRHSDLLERINADRFADGGWVGSAPASGAGGIVVNLNGPVWDGQAAARAIRDELLKLKRSGMKLNLSDAT